MVDDKKKTQKRRRRVHLAHHLILVGHKTMRVILVILNVTCKHVSIKFQSRRLLTQRFSIEGPNRPLTISVSIHSFLYFPYMPN